MPKSLLFTFMGIFRFLGRVIGKTSKPPTRLYPVT